MKLEPVSTVPLVSPTEQEMGPHHIPEGGAGSPPPRQPLFTTRLIGYGILLGSLAFLLASTAARNSDLWLHLASGRWVGEHGLPDGTEPFSSATQGIFWVNHSWLSDWLLYSCYHLGGGKILLVGKVILVTGLALMLLCFRRRNDNVGVLAFAGIAALLALAPWLVLQPLLLSLFGVVLTLYVLERPYLVEERSAGRAWGGRWLLVPLFALWANLDEWFLLGPVLLSLYTLGEWIHRPGKSIETRKPGFLASSAGSLALLFAALAACLATPYHYRIFAWPALLGQSYTNHALLHDPLGPTLVFSPLGPHFTASPVFRSPGAWAYYFLLVASAISFILAFRTVSLGRFFSWFVLAVLSIYQARTIPLFALLAAPCLALNIQEWAGRREISARWQRLHETATRLGVLLGLILLVLAWPGWLQPAPYQSRSWSVEPDGSLVRLAARLKLWHSQHRFTDDRVALTFSPEVAHYLAWFCPEEKGFVDSRWPLFDSVADDYVRMRQCLLQGTAGETDAELNALLRKHRMDRILLHDGDWERLSRVYRHLFLAAPEWELLAVEGGATVFRRGGEASSGEVFDFRQAAYHPAPDQRVQSAPRPPRAPGLFDAFRLVPHSSSADREEAALDVLSFELEAERFALSWVLAQETGVIGLGAGNDLTATACTLAARLHFTPPVPPAPPEALYLAVRAARRALHANPDDGRAYLLLGQAYYRLARQTPEASWRTLLPSLSSLRRVQMLTVLEQAVLLRPDLDQAHALLAQLYIEPDRMFEEGQADRCLEHLRARVRLAEQFPERRDALERDVQKLDDLLGKAQKIYQANLAGKTEPSRVVARAQLAARYGLSRKALEMMLESYPAIYGKAGVEYELELLLQSGQSYQVLDILEPQHEQQIDFFLYHWLRACAAASCGRYEEADQELDRSGERQRRLRLSPQSPLPLPLRSVMAVRAAQAALTLSFDLEGVVGRASALFFQLKQVEPLEALASFLLQEADRQVLRGLLALEAGEVETARELFRSALQVWGGEQTAGRLDFPARPIAQEMFRRLQE